MTFNTEIVWLVISFILTLAVFSFLLGDNPFFRFVSALLIGITAGYFTVVIIYQVLLARLAVPLLQGSRGDAATAAAFRAFIDETFTEVEPVGESPMALLIGVGAAVAIGGAVLGTLFGQVKGALAFFDVAFSQSGSSRALIMVEAVFFLLGTFTTLFYFHFSARKVKGKEPRRHWSIGALSSIGKVFISVTLGAVFAGVLTATITALVERADFLVTTITAWVR